jgi:hypothetical protein
MNAKKIILTLYPNVRNDSGTNLIIVDSPDIAIEGGAKAMVTWISKKASV